ncbi:MAG TPA: isoprenylcysteine carboxylmethyltransferase family protein [Vicinamibacterales bacterium]|nr:isoprenylcysteine carboxylmethyltransferase family protein [Vicinamibacterales bacterium]
MRVDFAVYAVHAAFWASFGITQRFVGAGHAVTAPAPATAAPATAPHSRLVLAVHFVAFAVMYMGIGGAVFSNRVPDWFPGQRIVGTVVMAIGAWLMCWSLVYFRSWRFRATLDAGHELATGGPYAIVRHPIYAGMNLLAVGTAIWIPNVLAWAAVVLMVIGSDLRARAEEQLLTDAFGDTYRDYCARTRRFLPGIY